MQVNASPCADGNADVFQNKFVESNFLNGDLVGGWKGK
jgi:hypothetical protein